jgi:hypothetical protein
VAQVAGRATAHRIAAARTVAPAPWSSDRLQMIEELSRTLEAEVGAEGGQVLGDEIERVGAQAHHAAGVVHGLDLAG